MTSQRIRCLMRPSIRPPTLFYKRQTEVRQEWRCRRQAMLQDRYWNLLAVNDATRTVFGYNATDHNCLITFFTNTRYRDLNVH
jgi:hypothetical protein